ncbi:MAG: hypothetical protein R2748_01110 [Bryobacterales bacterium]
MVLAMRVGDVKLNVYKAPKADDTPKTNISEASLAAVFAQYDIKFPPQAPFSFSHNGIANRRGALAPVNG